MEQHELVPLVEALLFVSDQPLTVNALAKAVDQEAVGAPEIKAALDSLDAELESGPRGFKLARFGNGYQLVTQERFAGWVEGLISGKRKARLSRAALETAAVIAYKQPITRLEIERVRGVDAGGVINTLLERGLIMIKGRDPGPGRPLMYGSTQAFLEYFGLSKLSDLPRLEELAALAKRERDAIWDDTELARFQKHGIDEEDVPPHPDADGDPETAEDSEARENDRADFQEVVENLVEEEFEPEEDEVQPPA